MHKEAGRPIPQLDPDPVIDYMVLEAIAVKIKHEENEAAKKDQRADWKRDTGSLDHLR